MLRILGVDPGTLRCGYALIEIDAACKPVSPRYLECGVIELSASQAIETRLKNLAADLREVITEFAPTELALETAFAGINVYSALLLGQARGVILLTAVEAGLGCWEYPPATVKKTVCGNGRAQKSEVQRVVSWLCGLDSQPPTDAADAVAIALCHAFRRPGYALRCDAPTGRTGGRPARTRRKPAQQSPGQF